MNQGFRFCYQKLKASPLPLPLLLCCSRKFAGFIVGHDLVYAINSLPQQASEYKFNKDMFLYQFGQIYFMIT